MIRISIFSIDFLRRKTLELSILLIFISCSSQVIFSQTISHGIRFNMETVAYSWHKSSSPDPSFRITSRWGKNYSLSSEFSIKEFFIPVSLSVGLNLRNMNVKISKSNSYYGSDSFIYISNKIVSKYEAEYQYAGLNFLFHQLIRRKSNYWIHSKVCYGLSYNLLVHKKVIENSHVEHLRINHSPFQVNDPNDTDITVTKTATEALGYAPRKGFWTVPVSICLEFRVYKGLFLSLQGGISLLPYDRFSSDRYERDLRGPGFGFGISYTFEKTTK